MTAVNSFKLQRFFKDKDGHVVIAQLPNLPLGGWIVFKLLSLLTAQNHLKKGLAQVSLVFLFTWAYLEITEGVNYFRRLLGLSIMLVIIISILK